MAGILSRGIKFYYGTGIGSSATWTELENLLECPQMGGAADKVEVTTLADVNKTYINGIKDFGDLEFTFLYDNSSSDSNYRVLKTFETAGLSHSWKVEFPDETTFTFSGQVSTKISAAAVNARLEFTATITLNSGITVSNPSSGS